MGTVAMELRITGRVQGVAYRCWLRAAAQARGLAGWVRNRPDGSVSAHVEGDRAQVEELIKDCWAGPGAAVVRNVESRNVPAGDGFGDFRILR